MNVVCVRFVFVCECMVCCVCVVSVLLMLVNVFV